MAGRYFDEWTVGDSIEHAIRRTVTETDNLLFSTMTHSTHPMHIDLEAANAAGFDRPLVASCFTLSLMIGISSPDTTLGTLLINIGFNQVVFPSPVLTGDTLHAHTEIKELRESKSRPAAGIVVFEHRMLNQRDEIVCQCLRPAILHRKPA